ncbi:MAG: phasin family protein [Casimicrobiaceae bacterium]
MIASTTRSAACSGDSVGTFSYTLVGAIIGVRTSVILIVVKSMPLSRHTDAAQAANESSADFDATYAEKRGAFDSTPIDRDVDEVAVVLRGPYTAALAFDGAPPPLVCYLWKRRIQCTLARCFVEETAMLKKAKAEVGAKSGGQAQGLSKTVLESSRQIWLAGLGAFAKAQEGGAKVFETLVKQGEVLEARTRQAAAQTADAARVAAKSRAKEMQAIAGGTWDKLEQVFEDPVSRALGKLGVYSASDVERLGKRVDDLSAAVNALLKTRGGRPKPPAGSMAKAARRASRTGVKTAPGATGSAAKTASGKTGHAKKPGHAAKPASK